MTAKATTIDDITVYLAHGIGFYHGDDLHPDAEVIQMEIGDHTYVRFYCTAQRLREIACVMLAELGAGSEVEP